MTCSLVRPLRRKCSFAVEEFLKLTTAQEPRYSGNISSHTLPWTRFQNVVLPPDELMWSRMLRACIAYVASLVYMVSG